MNLVNVQLRPDGPITQMDRTRLECRYGLIDNAHEQTTWVEYYLPGQYERAVHRSVHVTLKKGVGIEAVLGRMGG